MGPYITREFAGWPPTLAAATVVIVLGVLLIRWAARRAGVPVQPALIVLVVLVAVAVTLRATVGIFFMATDAIVYDSQAMAVADRLHGLDTDPRIVPGKEGWPFLLGLVYFLAGHVPFAGLIIGCVATALSVVFVAKTAVVLWGGFSEPLLLLAYLASPLVLLFGPSLMRESLCWAATAAACCGAALVVERRPHGLTLFVVAVLAFMAVRLTLGLLLAGALTLLIVLIRLARARRYWWIAGISIASIIVFQVGGGLALDALGFDSDYLEANRQELSEIALTGFDPAPLGSGPLGLLWSATQLLPRLIVGPFPDEWGPEVVWLWVAVTTVVWFAVLFTALVRMYRAPRLWLAVLLVLGTLAVLLGMALTLTNYGIVVRLRGIPAIMLLPLVVGVVRGDQALSTSSLTASWSETLGDQPSRPRARRMSIPKSRGAAPARSTRSIAGSAIPSSAATDR